MSSTFFFAQNNGGAVMRRMWSPWRSKYIETFKKPVKRSKRADSIFTAAMKQNNDDKHFILWRGNTCFVIMNLFPYNSGHLLIVPYRQRASLDDLTDEELLEIMHATQRSKRALDRVMSPHGFNFGANIGTAGGAGVDNHLHFHLVPRWSGDTNFMPIIGGAKVISEDMKRTLKKLRKVF